MLSESNEALPSLDGTDGTCHYLFHSVDKLHFSASYDVGTYPAHLTLNIPVHFGTGKRSDHALSTRDKYEMSHVNARHQGEMLTRPG